jgi:solute carrier family 25 carnitine/acylcarnitine transporter 20/29
MSDTKESFAGIKSFLSGGFGGMSLVFVGHPLDTIKVRLQTNSQYSGMLDCARQTIAQDGVKGLYRGMAAPLIGITPIFATYFWGFDVGKAIAASFEGKEKSDISTAGIIFAGGFSALPGTAVMVPGERVKILLQIQGQSKAPPKYKGALDCITTVAKEEGVIGGLYKGTALTLMRDVPGSMAYYAAYEIILRAIAGKDTKELSVAATLFSGGMAGVCNWLVSVPPDVIKSRYQTAEAGRYSGMGQVLSELLKNEGVGALYKGLGPAIVRAFPANAACFLGMEVSRKAMNVLF